MKISFVGAILGTLTLVLAFHVGKVQGQSCSGGWFGDSCQFKCHCKNSGKKSIKCNRDGTCPSGYKCEGGWFGPACQYVDLAAEGTAQPEIIKLTDGDDNSCLGTQSSQSVTLDLKNKFLFTWMRLYVSDSSHLHDMSLQLKDLAKSIGCLNQRNNTINDNTIDIFCDIEVPVRYVYLKGEGINSLCSVYVSGGRNVALKQNAIQSTTHNLYGLASNAVDGNPDGDTSHRSCSHTANASDPFWNLEFHSPMRVNRYIIYNRVESCCPHIERRIQGFIIKSFNESNEVYHYKDRESLKSKYIVQPDSPRDSVSKVEISLKGPVKFLTLCEVEIFGDCGAGTFDLKCDRFCSNCAGDCYPSNGHCVFGCKEGYVGKLCDSTCPRGSFGLNCLRKCSPQCGGTNGCNHVNGTCIDTDCTPGYKGPLCNETCPPGSFGVNCLRKCSPQCGGTNGCNRENGMCNDTHCTPGYRGLLCNETCPFGKFGPNCLQYCSPYCAGTKSCNPINGTCNCAPGYKGPLCDENPTGLGLKIVVAGSLLALIPLVFASFLFCGRKYETEHSEANITDMET